MEDLFVQKLIEINAPIEKVWKALTESEFTKQWIKEGWATPGDEGMIISSDWKPGSEVLWKSSDGAVLVKGNITSLNPYRLIHFTVRDVSSKEEFSDRDDGITYELTERNNFTMLSVKQGDFSIMKEGRKYYEKTNEIWERALPKIKALAETIGDIPEEPTCGSGLSSSSILPARFSEVIESMAENLELHMETLDLEDPNAKLEFGVYQQLAREHRDIAARLMAVAVKMYSQHDLPLARHDENRLSNPKIVEAFKAFTGLEEELVTSLQKHIQADKKILVEATV
jgi:uncharacterized protein YndB with AHSA1/START domain